MPVLLKGLLLALVVALPLMKPAIRYPVVLADILFVLLGLALAGAMLARRLRPRWRPAYWVLVLYVAGLAASVPFSEDPGTSLFKLVTQLYLVGLAVAVDMLVADAKDMRHVVLTWLAVTALVVGTCVLSLAIWAFDPQSPLLDFFRYQFGTLPGGNYPRLSLTFYNANMLCNYITVSLGLLLLAWHCGWVGRRSAVLLGGGILLAAAFSISPGLGGIALAIGAWCWFIGRESAPRFARLAAAGGILAASVFVAAMTLTPILHPTAPWVGSIAGIPVAPSGRLMIWEDAAATFAANPLTGRGLGMDAAQVRYMDPTGHLQKLTDAHNVFLNIGAQAGLVGLAGLLLLIGYVLHASRPWRAAGHAAAARVGIGFIFLNGFVYHGLGGSFEDARHLWVLLGLFLAATRLEAAARDSSEPALRAELSHGR